MKEKIQILLTRSIDRIYPSRETFEQFLEKGKKITVYLGVDPTGTHLHLGHATNLLALKRFQDLGHKIILLIGDFTARIGDPSDRLAARKPLTKSEVNANLKTFRTQAAKIINFSGKNAATLRFNSKWFERMTFEKGIEIAQHFTEQQIVERDMFQERIKNNKPIGLHEFFYPLMQGYDSVAMNVDAEIGGTDQTFNMLAGRKLLREYKNKEKFIITTKLLINPRTGKKLMNKSEGGLINLDDAPNDMFGKVMALPDETIGPVAELCTEIPVDEIEQITESKNLRDSKLNLAFEIIKLYHNEKTANKAQKEWVETFSKNQLTENLPALKIKNKELEIIELLITSGVPSKSEARRLIKQNAIEINGTLKNNPEEIIRLHIGDTVKIGKKKFFRIV